MDATCISGKKFAWVYAILPAVPSFEKLKKRNSNKQKKTGNANALHMFCCASTIFLTSKTMSANGNAVMRPYEKSDIADVQYDWVKFRNGYLRAITRKPKGKTK